MNPSDANRALVAPALSLLPAAMDTPEARVMLLAIGQQESGFVYRRQIHGPARGYWMFETAGINAVLNHRATSDRATVVAKRLNYQPLAHVIYDALPDNGVLAAVFARLLLWTDPNPLPAREDAGAAWDLYTRVWRPGRPRRATWDGFHQRAVACLDWGEAA